MIILLGYTSLTHRTKSTNLSVYPFATSRQRKTVFPTPSFRCSTSSLFIPKESAVKRLSISLSIGIESSLICLLKQVTISFSDKTSDISNVPVVSMFAAAIGIPVQTCPHLNWKVRCRSTSFLDSRIDLFGRIKTSQ